MTVSQNSFLIVGGTKGIGFATARAAAEGGAQVTITGRTQPTLDAALAQLPTGVRGLTLDFGDPNSVAALASAVGSFDHLVLSASSAIAWGPLHALTEEAMRAAFEAKFWGYWRLTKALAPSLSAQGSITFVTGAAGRAALAGTSGVAAVNGAIEALAKVLASELAPLRVNTVSPGLTVTEAYDGMPEEARTQMFAGAAARLPAGRTGHPSDIAQAILLAALNPFMTGTTLDIDGGAHLAR